MPRHTHIDRADFQAHGACPSGALGITVARLMDRLNDRVQREVAAMIPPGADVLEVGFGGGGFMQQMRVALINSYTGFDLSTTMVSQAAEKVHRWGVAGLDLAGRFRVRSGDARKLCVPDCSYDIAVALNVAYYWDELGSAMFELHRVLQIGGELVLGIASNTSGQSFAYAHHHHPDAILAAMNHAGFRGCGVDGFEETVTDEAESVRRRYYLITGTKMRRT